MRARERGNEHAESRTFAQATAMAPVPMPLTDTTAFVLCDSTFIRFKTGETNLWCWKMGQVVHLGRGHNDWKSPGSTSGY